jgi:hypothetical protein
MYHNRISHDKIVCLNFNLVLKGRSNKAIFSNGPD